MKEILLGMMKKICVRTSVSWLRMILDISSRTVGD